jgi:hypothetical protein
MRIMVPIQFSAKVNSLKSFVKTTCLPPGSQPAQTETKILNPKHETRSMFQFA